MIPALVLPGYEAGYRIAEKLGAKVVGLSEKTFPDGELYVKVESPEELAGKDVLVVSTMYPRQLESLFKTLMIVNAALNAGAKRILLVAAYLPYARQDKVFLPGEPVSGCIVTKTLRSAGVGFLATVDVHSTKVLECYEGPYLNVLVSDLLVEHALKYLENPVVIAPDKGALERASYAAKKLGLESDYLVKQRDRVTGEVSYAPRELSVSGRDVVIVDDIISTGGTIAEATRMLLKQGARRVVVAATHGLLVGDAMAKIERAGAYRVVLANTLATVHEHSMVEYVDISGRIAESLRGVI